MQKQVGQLPLDCLPQRAVPVCVTVEKTASVWNRTPGLATVWLRRISEDEDVAQAPAAGVVGPFLEFAAARVNPNAIAVVACSSARSGSWRRRN